MAKKGSKSSTNNHDEDSKAMDDEKKSVVRFVFEGEKFYARAPICFDTLTLKDLLSTVTLDLDLPPPTPHELFEIYFKIDIYPHVRHHVQAQIRSKRDISKLWDTQSIILQNVYKQRSELLRQHWLKLKAEAKKSKHSITNELDDILRKKAQIKAKNKENKQKWKEQIALQIASGAFDDELSVSSNRSKPNLKSGKSHKKAKEKKSKNNVKNKSNKNKKNRLKPWKEKKVKTVADWPTMDPTMAPKTDLTNTNQSKNVNVNRPKTPNVIATDSPNKKQIKTQHKNPRKSSHKKPLKSANISSSSLASSARSERVDGKKWIYSELKYKFLIRSKQTEYVLDNERQSMIEYIETFKKYENDLILMKIWICIDTVYENKHSPNALLLNTNKETVILSVNEYKLFEILWTDFGENVKERIDTERIEVAFVKKTKMLRLRIPILSM